MVTQVKTVKLRPPAELMKTCALPEYRGTTWGEVVNYTVTLQDIIKRCEARDKARNEWYDQTEPQSTSKR
ncbi:MAG: hypothetical protein ACN2B6_12555 [Rickettsiales bacterium]